VRPRANTCDRNYRVLAKPNVIKNDTRLRGLAIAGSDAAGRKTVHNHAQPRGTYDGDDGRTTSTLRPGVSQTRTPALVRTEKQW
jgi:hypothetical protein